MIVPSEQSLQQPREMYNFAKKHSKISFLAGLQQSTGNGVHIYVTIVFLNFSIFCFVSLTASLRLICFAIRFMSAIHKISLLLDCATRDRKTDTVCKCLQFCVYNSTLKSPLQNSFSYIKSHFN